jgi:ComF family protein
MSRLDRLRQQFLSLFLKSNCPLCDRSAEEVLCRYCRRQLQDCKLAQPDRYWQGDLPLFAWGKYEGAVKRSLAKLKYDGHRSIGDLYGEWLADSWQKSSLADLTNRSIVVPIPLHPEKLAARGFNQAELIARRFSRVTGHKLDLSLQRTRSTSAQFGLSKSARQENVEGAFLVAANSALKPGDRVLLIDDIYTTGATVRAAVAGLKAMQIDVCGVAVVALVTTGKDPVDRSTTDDFTNVTARENN